MKSIKIMVVGLVLLVSGCGITSNVEDPDKVYAISNSFSTEDVNRIGRTLAYYRGSIDRWSNLPQSDLSPVMTLDLRMNWDSMLSEYDIIRRNVRGRWEEHTPVETQYFVYLEVKTRSVNRAMLEGIESQDKRKIMRNMARLHDIVTEMIKL